VILDKDADTDLWIIAGGQPLAQALDDCREGVTLDEIKQLFLRLEIVIKTRKLTAAQARQVTHRGALVSLVGENLGGAVKNLGQTAVKTGIVGRRTFQGARC